MTSSATPTDDRGRSATTPMEIPFSGWRDILIRTWRESTKDNLSLIAAGVTFYAFLTIVPLLGAMVLVYGLVADPATVVANMQGLTSVMPADAAKLIGEQLMQVVQTAGSKKGLGLLAALGIALYGATKGMGAVVTAMNIVYGEEETRGFVKTTLLTLAMTLGAVVVGIVAILAISAMSAIERLLPTSAPFVHTVVTIALWVFAAALMSAAIAAVYRYAPARDKAQWSWLSAGSILATLLILGATLAFGFYVSNFGSYNATYGSLGAVIVLLTWLNLSAYILLFGAELNAELEHQTRADTTDGPVKPEGQRGARMADTVGETP
ncbi:MAG TPA: YihY/virulence factor BrkB family protein [Sphingomonadaceae bacterium]|nr:YihY/virulence factor BrkB family protein [Sphingomonadaceae bacterium]